MKMRSGSIVCLAVVAALHFINQPLRADEASANKYLEQAKKQAADKDSPATVETSLKLAEVELDGVEPAKKAPLVQAIAAVREQVKSAEMAAFKTNVERELANMFKTAEATLGARNTGIVKTLDDLEAKLNDPKTKEALGAATVDAQLKQLATFRKVNTDKMRENDLAAATRDVEYVETQFPQWMKDLTDGSPNAKSGAAESMERRYAGFQQTIKEIPQDDPALVALVARMNKMKTQVDGAFGNVMVAEVLDRLKRNWEIDSAEFAGWEAETTVPSFQQLVKERSAATSKLGAPKTAAAAARARRFFESLATNEQAKPLADQSPLKEFIASIAKLRTDTEARLAGTAEAILADAEKTNLDKDGRDRLEYFAKDDLRLTLQGHPQLPAWQARAQAKIAAFDTAATAGAEAKSKEYEKRKAEAAARWPVLIADVDYSEDFDPAKAADYKGKLIRIKDRQNRAGYDFGSDGAFDYAIDIDGKPVAGRFAPEVRAAIEDLRTATGRDLTTDDDCDILAVYEGTNGKLVRRVDVEGEVNFEGGGTAKVRAEDRVPVDAPVLKIVGLYSGPVAVYSQFSADGAVTSKAGIGFGTRLFGLLLMGLAGFAVLLKAEFAPLAASPSMAPVRANLSSRNQIAIGIAFLIVALLYMIYGKIYYGLLGNLALAAAGVYLALDAFQTQSWWKPELSQKLRALAIPIGLACIGIGLWRLIFSFPAFV
jgi:hypothetical protein